MPPRRVIGIDAGGTKLLGGVVDEQMVVHHRVHRTWRGADRQETVDILTDAVEEVRAAASDVEAIGFGVPALVESETGVTRWSSGSGCRWWWTTTEMRRCSRRRAAARPPVPAMR
jgi:predicted NBD/HSP70 family sugar kinase